MKCPNCKYNNGWDGESLSMIRGEHGDFYYQSVEMQRPKAWETGAEVLYACPSCRNAFIEVHN